MAPTVLEAPRSLDGRVKKILSSEDIKHDMFATVCKFMHPEGAYGSVFYSQEEVDAVLETFDPSSPNAIYNLLGKPALLQLHWMKSKEENDRNHPIQKYEDTTTHSLGSTIVYLIIAKRLQKEQGVFSDEEISLGKVGMMLHDVDKAKVSNKTLHNPGDLSPQEVAIMRGHPVGGQQTANSLGFYQPEVLLPIVGHHVDFQQGAETSRYQGYPEQLPEELERLAASDEKFHYLHWVASVADTVDAMRRGRSYRQTEAFRRGLNKEQMVDELNRASRPTKEGRIQLHRPTALAAIRYFMDAKK